MTLTGARATVVPADHSLCITFSFVFLYGPEKVLRSSASDIMHMEKRVFASPMVFVLGYWRLGGLE